MQVAFFEMGVGSHNGIFPIISLIIGVRYPAQAGEIPVTVCAAVVITPLYRLMTHSPDWHRSRRAMATGINVGAIASRVYPENLWGHEAFRVAIVTRMGHREDLLLQDIEEPSTANTREFLAIVWFSALVTAFLVLGIEFCILLITLVYAVVERGIESFLRQLINLLFQLRPLPL